MKMANVNDAYQQKGVYTAQVIRRTSRLNTHGCLNICRGENWKFTRRKMWQCTGGGANATLMRGEFQLSRRQAAS